MKTNLRSSLFILALAAGLASCNKEKPYTIHGTLDLPDQVPYGDTIIDVPSFEGTWVYLIDFDSTPVDSAEIQDNNFLFEGSVKGDETYYLQFVSQIGNSLVAIEPGNIDINVTLNGILISGTSSNDAMSDADAVMENLNADTYARYSALVDSLQQLGQELSEEQHLRLAQEFQNAMAYQLDSIYQANQSNLGGPYALLLRHMDSESSAEFEEAISAYPEAIRNNQLLQYNLRMLRQYEAMYDTAADSDSLTLEPAEIETLTK